MEHTAPEVQTATPNAVQKLNLFSIVGVSLAGAVSACAREDPEGFATLDMEASQPACVEVEDEPSWATQEIQAAAEPLTLTLDHDSEGENEDDGNDDRSSSPDGSHTSDPDPLQWKSGLESILYEDDSIADV
ncbi:hypothetical protein NHJ13734_004479 [Beauveria thailandica]